MNMDESNRALDIPSPGRRRLLQGVMAAAAGGMALGGYAAFVEPHWLEIVSRPLPIRNLPRSLESKTLVQLSDLHVGPLVSDAYILETFERVNRLQPEIVVYTGDFTSFQSDLFEKAEQIYAQAPRGSLATLGIFGNHDYGWNWAHLDIAERLAAIFGSCGIQILRNEVRDVEGLQIVGMDDLWANQFNPGHALAKLRHDTAAIALSHNPDTVDMHGWGNYQGWILSGHTHGGQCKPPFLPPPILPVVNRRYTAGEFDLAGNRRLYINRGVGHLAQVRFGVRPEVTKFTLTPADT